MKIKRIYYYDYNGKETIDYWHKQGFEVLLDFKLIDIPATIQKTIQSAKDNGADYISIGQDIIIKLNGRD